MVALDWVDLTNVASGIFISSVTGSILKVDLNVTDKPDLIEMSLALFGGPGQTAPVAPPPSPLSAALHISGLIITIPRLFSEHSLKNENKNQVFHSYTWCGLAADF